MWNLLPSFKNINSSKNNDLPELDKYLMTFCNLQYEFFEFVRTNGMNKKSQKEVEKDLEDYVHIMPSEWEYERAWQQVSEDKFKECLRSTIVPLYQIAYNQGYNVWICKKNNSLYEETLMASNGLYGKIAEDSTTNNY